MTTIGRVARFSALGSALAACSTPAWAADCNADNLRALHVPGITLGSATLVAASGAIPEHCLVQGTVATSGSGAPPGTAGFQLQLPTAWQQRFLFLGVGGNAGSFTPSANPVDRAAALGKGYAVAITDTGHQGRDTDASWVIGANGARDQAKVIDFFHRAAHQVTLAGKALTEAYYAGRIGHAYFDGCSTGGRMAMMEAERYPTDYDGIIAGAPNMDYRSLLGRAAVQTAQLAGPGSYIPATLLPMVDKAVRAACDSADGQQDGLIQNPARCTFRPETLLCKPGQQADCLSPGQVATLRTYLSPVRDAKGHLVFPGMSPSDLAGPRGMQSWTVGATAPDLAIPPSRDGTPWGKDPAAAPAGWSFTRNAISYWLGRGPDARIADLGVDPRTGIASASAIKTVDTIFADAMTRDPARLQDFVRQGRKLIIYHGFSDPGISPFRTTAFYEQFSRMHGGYARTQQSVRLFMVPGMAHCSGGPGPENFDTLTALEGWVEHDAAPDAIVATATAPGSVKRTMPLCMVPELATYRGSGDVMDAANWRCGVAKVAAR